MPTYVDHAHVAWSFVGVALYFGVVSLHGTHCTPASREQVCITVR